MQSGRGSSAGARVQQVIAVGGTLLALAGCNGQGSKPAAAVQSAHVAPAEVVAAPSALRTKVVAGVGQVTWTVAASPVKGFSLFLDERPAVALPPATRSYALPRFESGTDHFIQLIAVGAAVQSAPVTVSFSQPYRPLPAQQTQDQTAVPTSQQGTDVAPAAVASSGIALKGTLTMSNVVEQDVHPTVDCGVQSIKLEVKNGSGNIVGLAALRPGRAYDVKKDQYDTSWFCDYPYAIDLDGSSPVYAFRAYYENLDSVKPWTSTVNTADLKHKAPKPYLSFCTCN